MRQTPDQNILIDFLQYSALNVACIVHKNINMTIYLHSFADGCDEFLL